MNPDDIEKWDAIRYRFSNEPVEDVFLDFSNLVSKHFMENEPEQWYRFCDGEYTDTNFHKEWLRLFTEHDKIAIESAREHHKTSFILNWILYNMWRTENFSVIYLSATHGQSKNKLQEFENLYKRNDWLNLEQNDGQWSKMHKQFENGSSIRGEGWGTAIEGAHVQLIVMDDILQERGAMTDSEVWDFYSRIVSPMSTENGQIILIGTKKRKGDIFDRVERNPEWVHRKFPSTPDDPIFPEKWPQERLEAKKREMLPRNFNREFGLEVIIEDNVLMPPSWNEKNRQPKMTYPTEGTKGGFNVMGVDPAISPTGDFAAFFSMQLNDNGVRRVLDVQRHQGMSLNQMMAKLDQLDTKFGYQVVMVEQNSFQRIIVNQAVETTSLPIRGHETTKAKSDPAEGIPRIAVQFENGKYMYPYKEQEDKEKTDMVHEALNSLQYDGGNLDNNHTPDMVMAKYMAEKAIMSTKSAQSGLDQPLVVGVEGSL